MTTEDRTSVRGPSMVAGTDYVMEVWNKPHHSCERVTFVGRTNDGMIKAMTPDDSYTVKIGKAETSIVMFENRLVLVGDGERNVAPRVTFHNVSAATDAMIAEMDAEREAAEQRAREAEAKRVEREKAAADKAQKRADSKAQKAEAKEQAKVDKAAKAAARKAESEAKKLQKDADKAAAKAAKAAEKVEAESAEADAEPETVEAEGAEA